MQGMNYPLAPRLRRGLLLCILSLHMPWLSAFELPTEPPKGTVILTINGKIGVKNTPDAAVFDAPLLDALPQHSFVTATPWFKAPTKFTGPLLRDVLQALKANGTHIKAIALNEYKIDIPIEDAFKYDIVLATQINGRVISVREKGPIFVIYPFDSHVELRNQTHYGRSIWQLKAFIVQ
jgi:hypothetical protein